MVLPRVLRAVAAAPRLRRLPALEVADCDRVGSELPLESRTPHADRDYIRVLELSMANYQEVAAD